MNPVVHVLRRMGGHATTLLPFSLAIGPSFQDVAAAARPLLWLATAMSHFGGSGHFFWGGLAVSNQRDSRITPRSSKRRPAICRPIGLPSFV